ncbi:MAG: hypothetical protein HY747_04895 [Elusimicrobia bacterium]|nr:hypothetical protein [Elusimicrobiota bacterium]
MQSLPEARLIIPAKEIFLEPAFSFIKTFAAGLGIEDSDLNNLSGAVEAVLKIIIDNNSRSEGEPLRITAAEAQGMLSIKIHNRGIPVVCGKNTDCTPAAAELLGKFRELSKKVDGLSTENLGRKGQVISIGKRLGKKALQKAFDPPALERLFPKNADKKIKIRRLKPQEASALSRLFYFVYGYNYINETIYYPEKLEAIMQDGRLISTAAVLPDGRIAGHVGLLKRQNEPPHFAAPWPPEAVAAGVRGCPGLS